MPADITAGEEDSELASELRHLLSARSPAEVRASIAADNTIRLESSNVRRLRLLLRPELFARDGPVRVLLNGREVFSKRVPHSCTLLNRTLAASGDPFLAHSAELTFEVAR